MEILLDLHTLERAKERGTNEEEIRDVIETGVIVSAKHGRIDKAKIYKFNTQIDHPPPSPSPSDGGGPGWG
jgi:hypothetical protein